MFILTSTYSSKPANIVCHESYRTNIIVQGRLLSKICKYGSSHLGATPMLKIHDISFSIRGVAYRLIVEVIERLVIIERLIILICLSQMQLEMGCILVYTIFCPFTEPRSPWWWSIGKRNEEQKKNQTWKP